MNIFLKKQQTFLVYDLENFHTDRAVPYYFCLNRLGRIASKHIRHLTNEEYQKGKKVIIVFDGTVCINKMLDWFVSLKREPRKVKDKILESELQ